MIDYTTVTEDGFTRACFTVDEAYFEVQINGVSEDDMQEFLAEEVQNINMFMKSSEEMEAMQAAEADQPE
jgi:hypothetical protein